MKKRGQIDIQCLLDILTPTIKRSRSRSISPRLSPKSQHSTSPIFFPSKSPHNFKKSAENITTIQPLSKSSERSSQIQVKNSVPRDVTFGVLIQTAKDRLFPYNTSQDFEDMSNQVLNEIESISNVLYKNYNGYKK